MVYINYSTGEIDKLPLFWSDNYRVQPYKSTQNAYKK